MNDSDLGLTYLIKIEKIEEWKAMGIASETISQYASPCLLVIKPDGSTRLVVDYRRLNKNTIHTL